MRPSIKVSIGDSQKNPILRPSTVAGGSLNGVSAFEFLDGRELLPGAQVQESSWELRSLAVSQREILSEGPKASRFPPPESVSSPSPELPRLGFIPLLNLQAAGALDLHPSPNYELLSQSGKDKQ